METAQPVFTLKQEIQTVTAEVGVIGITAIIIPQNDRGVKATKDANFKAAFNLRMLLKL